MAWKIEAKPEGRNGTATPEKNEGGMVVYLVNSAGSRQEVGRVAFERQNSTHPDVDFPTQLKTFIDAAKAAVEAIDELVDDSGVLQ